MDELPLGAQAENAIRWIDTSCMIVDCLTKKMCPDVILKFMRQGYLNLQPTVESQLLKMRKRKQRAAKKEAERGAALVLSATDCDP